MKALISGQRAVLRDVWPTVEGKLSEFDKGEYTKKRLEVFEADEAKLLVELRNYSQHKFFPFLSPAWHFSQAMPMAEFQFRLEVEPLLKWDKLNAEVRKYLGKHGNSLDLLPIIGRYSKSVREFYQWFWLKIDEKIKPERVEIRCARGRVDGLRRRSVPDAGLGPKSWRRATAWVEWCALASPLVG